MNFYQISAGDLAEFCFPEGSLGTMPSLERMHIGSRAHKKLQNVYSENEKIKYQREVPLDITFVRENITLKVQGRADGIIFDKKNYCIHEIKSTFIHFDSIDSPIKKAHKAQMMIYAYIYALNNNLSTIKGKLSYFCLNNDEIVDFEYSFDFEPLKSAVEAMVEEYVKLLKIKKKSEDEFEKTKTPLPFPFDNFRVSQREGAAQVFSAIKNNKNLFIQAPTGSGKTIMTLYPAVKACEKAQKIVCLCAKNQTMRVNNDAINLMRKKGLTVKSLVITAKSKACLMENVDCNPDICPYALDFYPKFYFALEEILITDDFSAEKINEIAQKYRICPYELSLELSEFCNIIIADYNYLFDPCVYIKRLFDNAGKYVFLIDEAHNLVERGRDMYSSFISKKEIRKIKKDLDKKSKLYRRLTSLNTQINKFIKQENELKDVVYASFSCLEAAEESAPPASCALFMQELVRFNTIYSLLDDKFKVFCDEDKVKIQCLDASNFLEENILKGNSAILYSATITPYEFYKSNILPTVESFGYSLPYPFDKQNLLVLADYGIDTRYEKREQYFKIIAQKIKACFEQAQNNIVVFFPSYAFLKSVCEICDFEVLIQEQQMTADEKAVFLEEFKNKKICAFCVMGSHFSEGIDFYNLSGIIIVGVALPQFNIERENIKEYFDNQQKGFEYAYLYPGINKVCQASGRLIRKAEDKGFILLLDNRFKLYKYLLPTYWDITETKDIKQDLSAFYKKVSSITPPPKQTSPE